MINHKTTCLFSKHMISTMKLTQRIFKNATKDIDITYPQFMLLKTIEKKQQMTIGDIVRISGIDQGNVSNMCKKLEKKGWLQRQRNPLDERVVLVSLSKEGINVLNRIQEYSHNKLEKILALLNQDDIEQIIDSIDRFIQCCEKVIYQEEVE